MLSKRIFELASQRYCHSLAAFKKFPALFTFVVSVCCTLLAFRSAHAADAAEIRNVPRNCRLDHSLSNWCGT